MNKHVKLFYKAYERRVKSPSIYTQKMFEKQLYRLITEFRYKHDVEQDQIELTKESKIKLHKNGVEVDIVEIVADLEHNIEKGIFYDYIDHKLTAEENGLKALNYEEFIRIRK